MYNYREINILSGQIQRNSLFIRLLFCITFSFVIFAANAQEITVRARNLPASEVVYSLVRSCNIQLSFNERQLSKEKITIDKSFSTPEDALEGILDGSGFEYKKLGDIFLILKKEEKRIILNGWIGDKYTGESLPFAHVIINGTGQVSDQSGRFVLETGSDQNEVKISYIGYYSVDTTLLSGSHKILLTPSVQGLEEIIVEGKKAIRSLEVGDSPGTIRLNSKIARKIPGNGDNAVFNFLRLQPGIVAAGEQSSDLIIWGGYEGHSKVMYDGYTIYGLKNFNDNISAVNPYMTKDILVLKGGYGAEYGGRVGGIVDITGISGDIYSPRINLNINNMTINGMASVPVNRHDALTFAFRRTYYNLVDPEDILGSLFTRRSNTDITVVPDYTFGDFNIKYAGKSLKLGSYYISLYQGKDDFQYRLDQERNNVAVIQENSESNNQRGGAIHWSRDLFDKFSSDFTVDYTELSSDVTLNQDIARLSNREQVFSRNKTSGNYVSEYGFLNRYFLTTGSETRNQLQAGIGYRQNLIELVSNVDDAEQLNTLSQTGRFVSYLSNNVIAGDFLEFKSGLRAEIPLNINRLYIQPRLSILFKPVKNLSTYLAWGIYNQFITKTSVLDDYGNYQYFWAIADNIDVPVLSSYHYVGGVSYKNNNILLSAEGYYKTTDGLSRYVNLLRLNLISVFPGDSRAYGGDFLVKGNFGKHEAWVSYSLSKTLEYFNYFLRDEYRFAPQDQRHEIKSSILLNFNPFYFSANYVYGSGFILRNTLVSVDDPERYPYNRLDLAIYYNVSVKDYTFEVGASVLNALNSENIKYSNFVRVPSEQLSSINIKAEAVPFTPAIFLNLSF